MLEQSGFRIDREALTQSLFSDEYLLERPLLRSIRSEKPVVLLIDEIDKADLEFPNDLLWELDRMEFYIHETKETVRAKHRPIVIITSNAEKELPDAFLRRCVFHYIEFPEQEQIRELERVVLLKVIDRKWMAHIDDMEQLRQGAGLQAYGQRDPLVEYKMNSYDMFDDMTASVKEDTVRLLYHARIEQKAEREEVAKVTGTNKDDSVAKAPKRRDAAKIYPNDPCPCGSGKKYKQCHGRNLV